VGQPVEGRILGVEGLRHGVDSVALVRCTPAMNARSVDMVAAGLLVQGRAGRDCVLVPQGCFMPP